MLAARVAPVDGEAGAAAVNAIAATVGADVLVVDVGVASDLPTHPRLRHARVRPGTADLSEGLLAVPIVVAAAAVLRDMATFDEARIPRGQKGTGVPLGQET